MAASQFGRFDSRNCRAYTEHRVPQQLLLRGVSSSYRSRGLSRTLSPRRSDGRTDEKDARRISTRCRTMELTIIRAVRHELRTDRNRSAAGRPRSPRSTAVHIHVGYPAILSRSAAIDPTCERARRTQSATRRICATIITGQRESEKHRASLNNNCCSSSRVRSTSSALHEGSIASALGSPKPDFR